MVIQLPVQSIIHRVVVVYGIRTRSCVLPSTVNQPRRDIISVPVFAHLQITLGPALGSNLYRVVHIPIDIGDRGNPRTGLTRCWRKRLLIAIENSCCSSCISSSIMNLISHHTTRKHLRESITTRTYNHFISRHRRIG